MGGHHHADVLVDPARRRRANMILWILLAPIGVLALVATIVLWPSGGLAKSPLGDIFGTANGAELSTGTVTRTVSEVCPSTEGLDQVGGKELQCQISYIAPAEGGASFALEVPPETTQSRPLKAEDKIKYLDMSHTSDSSAPYVFVDFVRSTPLVLLGLAYVAVVCLVARWRGLRALAGLVGGLYFIIGFMVPALLEGKSPTLVGLTTATVVMFAALYFAHGFSARTSTALLGTLFGLGVTAVIAVWATDAAALTGATDDSALTLSTVVPDLSLSGLLLCGLLIAGMGVLNDVTITQSSAVWELAELAPHSSAKQLFTAGMRIGRDHIASTVYTIAFAYAGAALPILVLVSLYDRPLLDSLTTGQMAEEVIRILVGSIGLVLAIPVTTAIAVAVVKATGSGAKPSGRRSLGTPDDGEATHPGHGREIEVGAAPPLNI
ncbi:YibE/F family protein [Paeniglutamicibacter gangotriensis]|uniref:YibE/F family protein n=1 Tax=Paeniglutamicibacter gangotriensis Lz1y TaxID=1276920 RepID=M7MQ09_9MICC|nr:YibE/F family protein [Paeniglutamicibacter gangotriensis]EMQ98457.1 YibE/F family protein [Paeniglutamicibacter gangotriensis Lz1y]